MVLVVLIVMVRIKLLVIPHAHGLGLGDDYGNGSSDGEEKLLVIPDAHGLGRVRLRPHVHGGARARGGAGHQIIRSSC